MICERVRAGVAGARRKGIRLGRPAKVFERWRIPELRRQGMSIFKIATRIGVSTATVRRELFKAEQNPPSESVTMSQIQTALTRRKA